MSSRGANSIATEGLTFGYGQRLLFASFQFNSERRITLLRGPSGCGKTTLLKLIGGFLMPLSGEVFVDGRKPILTVQDDSLWPWLSGLENIETISGVSRDELEGFALFPLISDFFLQPAHEMSYGQRRSIELVRTLLKPDRLILWDEPFNFLDRTRREQVLHYINRPDNTTRFVMTSHYTENFASDSLDVFEFAGDAPYSRLVRASEQQL